MMGYDYEFAYRVTPGKAFDPTIEKIMLDINKEMNRNFNSCLLNCYKSGLSVIGDHFDATDKLVGGDDAVVACLSIGSSRVFRLSSRHTNEKVELPLHHNTVLVMGSGTQLNYVHGILADKKCQMPRISMTFREFK